MVFSAMPAADQPQNELAPPRSARLVLVGPNGAVIGCLPAVPVSTPWWPEAAPVVTAIKSRYGVEVTILRLLESERDRPHGGVVTYLAEVSEPVQAEEWRGDCCLTRFVKLMPSPAARPPIWLGRTRRWRRSGWSPRDGQCKSGLGTCRASGDPDKNRDGLVEVGSDFFAHEGLLLSALAGLGVPDLLRFRRGADAA